MIGSEKLWPCVWQNDRKKVPLEIGRQHEVAKKMNVNKQPNQFPLLDRHPELARYKWFSYLSKLNCKDQWIGLSKNDIGTRFIFSWYPSWFVILYRSMEIDMSYFDEFKANWTGSERKVNEKGQERTRTERKKDRKGTDRERQRTERERQWTGNTRCALFFVLADKFRTIVSRSRLWTIAHLTVGWVILSVIKSVNLLVVCDNRRSGQKPIKEYPSLHKQINDLQYSVWYFLSHSIAKIVVTLFWIFRDLSTLLEDKFLRLRD